MKTGEHSWSLAELVHAVVLLAHFHALSSFVFGSGVNHDPEVTEVSGVSDDLCPPAMASLCTCHLTNSNQANRNAQRNAGVRRASMCCFRELHLCTTHVLLFCVSE